MEVRVLLEGPLEKCTGTDFEEHGKRDWKRRHFVLKHVLASNIKSLEFYSAGTKNWRKAEPKGVLTLYPGFEVVKVYEPKRQFVFEIKTIDHTVRLAAHSEDELNQWLFTLEKENIVNSFYVEPEPSEAMSKLGAIDMCHLNISKKDVSLYCARDGRLLVAWPFTCLRRYMSKQGKFTIEAGRRAPTGEGSFSFSTPQHDDIYKHLDNVIKSRASQMTGTPSSRTQLKKTKSAPIDTGSVQHFGAENGYVHLGPHMSSPAQAHTPVTDQSTSPRKALTLRDRAYASPYGHLLSRGKFPGISPLSGMSSLETDSGDQYNTLSHASEGQFFKQDQSEVNDDYSTLNPAAAISWEVEGAYNVLMHGNSSKPPLLPSYSVQHAQDVADVYNVIGKTLKQVTATNEVRNEEDMYNTLDLGSSQHKNSTNSKQLPLQEQGEREGVYNCLDQSVLPSASAAPQADNMYCKLGNGSPRRPHHKQVHVTAGADSCDCPDRCPPSPKPKPRGASKPQRSLVCNLFDQVSKLQSLHQHSSIDEDDTYDTLKVPHIASTEKSAPSLSAVGADDESMYNTLDTRPSPYSIANISERCMPSVNPTFYRKETSQAKRSTIPSTQSGSCPLDIPSSEGEVCLEGASCEDDLESYACINYSAMSPQRERQKLPPKPAQRSLSSKTPTSPPESRKTSAPDILKIVVDHTVKDTEKGGRFGLVSNLKASLEAGGMDSTKPKGKPKKLSHEESVERPEIAEQSKQQSFPNDGFLPVNPSTRGMRSQSSPSEPGSLGGDQIYDELDHTADVRPKSHQIAKPTNSPKKKS